MQLNEALLKSEERFKSAFDNILEGCQIIGFDWRYIYLNSSAENHNRRPNKELIGNRYQDMWPGIEKTEVFKIIKQVLETRIPYQFENEFIFPDGSPGWFDLNIQPVPEGVFILSIDISERKKAELALLESEEKYRLISDNSEDWIYWIAPDGNFLYVSPACERVTGYSPEEFINHPELIYKIVYDADKALLNQHFHNTQINDGHRELEYRIITKKGELRWISHNCSPMLNKQGEFMGHRGTNHNITQRKLQEQKLFESEFRFNKLYENSALGMVLANEKSQFIKTNPAFCAIMGYSESELLKMTYKDISLADELKENLSNIQKLIRKETSVYKTEKHYVRKDGQIIWGALTVVANFADDGNFLYNLATVEDITRKKQAEDEIKSLNERISTATRASQVGIWDWDIKNDILNWDDQMYTLYGLKKNELKNAYEVWISGLHPDDREFSENETRQAILGLKEYDTEFRVVWPDGSIHFIKSKAEVFRDEMNVAVRMVGINLDITERKKTEQEIIKLNNTLEQRVIERTSQLEAANKELEAFSYSVSHDLRAPLRHINGYVDLLNTRYLDNLPEKAQHYLNTITVASKQMGQLIDDLLQFSRTGRQELHKVKFDMNILINEVLEKMKPDIINRKIVWNIQKLPEAFGDSSLIKQVWINLLDNALKYSKYKEKTEITIDFRNEGQNFVFLVHDNGVGFDMKYANKLFGVFQRLHPQSEFEGTGIGLANVQRIIHKHNGRIWAEAEPDKGATFYFTLPKY